MHERNSSKTNTILLSICLLVLSGLGTIGYGIMEKTSKTAEDVAALRATLPPMSMEQNRQELEIVELRTRISAIEVKVAEIQGRQKP